VISCGSSEFAHQVSFVWYNIVCQKHEIGLGLGPWTLVSGIWQGGYWEYPNVSKLNGVDVSNVHTGNVQVLMRNILYTYSSCHEAYILIQRPRLLQQWHNSVVIRWLLWWVKLIHAYTQYGGHIIWERWWGVELFG